MERRPWLLLGPVLLYVHLRGFRGVVRRMKRVAVGDMRVMRCLLVVPLIVMCRGFFMMSSDVFGRPTADHVKRSLSLPDRTGSRRLRAPLPSGEALSVFAERVSPGLPAGW